MSFDELPRIDPPRVQSSASVLAFEGLFALPNFIPRPTNPDIGIDYNVELAENSRGSNIHFSVQLKSVQQGEFDNASQALKFSIETSRLHYLSRTLGGSLIVIYDASSRTMFYRWVHEIIPELDAQGVSWRGQETVTIRLPLANILNTASSLIIHSTVGTLYRRLQQSSVEAGILPPMESFGASAEQRRFFGASGAPETELLATLSISGIGFASAGLHRQVIDAYSRIPSAQWSSSPRHLLTIAYAYEFSGQPLQALTYSKAALAFTGPAVLAPEDLAVADLIRLNSESSIGILDHEQFYAAIRSFVDRHPGTPESVQARLQLLLREMVTIRRGTPEPDPMGRVRSIFESAKAEAKAVSVVPGQTKYQWGVRLILARIEFQLGNQLFIDGSFRINASRHMGHPLPRGEREAIALEAIGVEISATRRVEALMQAAAAEDRSDLVAVCKHELATNQFNFLMLARAFRVEGGRASGDAGEATQLQRCLDENENAINVFSQLGRESLRIKATRLKADILNAMGRREEANAILEGVKRDMLAAGIDSSQARFTEFSDAPTSEAEKHKFLLDASDSDVEQIARDSMRVLMLPESRFQNVLKDFRTMRQILHEKQSWCKHIELIQQLGHTASRATIYAVDPQRRCMCLRFEYESSIGSTDVDAVIMAFKAAHCDSCAVREPKSASA